MLLIFTPKVNNRIKYIFDVIFRNLISIDYRFTNNAEEFKSYDGPKINYSYQPISDEIFFCSVNLLFETGIKQQQFDSVKFENILCPYSVYKNSALPFDPFAASFYMLSRYEEYLPYKKDKYDRFDAIESIAYINGFLKKPVVNIWAQKIKLLLKEKYPFIKFPEKNYRFLSTIDIDSAWEYKQKGIVRTIAGFIKALYALNFQEISKRMRVLTGLKKDSFDTFEYQFELHKKYNIVPLYFILFADYAQYDKNIYVNNRKFQSLVKSIGDYADVGIHPSFASNIKHEKLLTEITRLSNVLNRDISKSRQHFLKLTFPDTYRNLIEVDIAEDYSLGYATETGFRAGICEPYNFFDLDLETETHLKLFPFAIMEGTLRDYHNVTPQDAIQQYKQLIDEVKAVNGMFISLWHNESLSNENRWVGWQKVYEEMLKMALS
ncbi:MAG TPA: polysaccharide deacetylase family protein [Bacteroidales bacterium]|nr:polysaccharide deacetylase family protein [Bacteroidales bacterium]HPS17976.1 polysaccharide deacetylase family protein [Bacteroidales bacterium]